MRNILYSRLDDISRPAAGGLAAPVELLRGVKTHALLVRATLQVTISGGAGGSVKEEGISKLIEAFRLTENGKPVIDLTGRMLGYITSKHSRQTANIGVLSATAAATYTVRADYVLPFADIYGADPGETCFVERDSRFPTKLQVQFAADAQGALITGTGLVVDSFGLEIVQMYDPNSKTMPFFLPRIRKTSSNNITGSPTGFRTMVLPESANRVADVVAHAISDGVTVDTMFTGNVTFRGDKIRLIDNVNFRTVLNEFRRFYNAPTVRAGYLPILSRFYGKLSECIIASQDDNWRLEADMTGPGTTNTLDVFTFELEAVPGYTRDLPASW
jgi:hypothetical protein